jgi:hypothetical protein
MIRQLKKSREKFADRVFTPSITSLVNSVKKYKRTEWASYEWVRISELYKQQKPVLYDEISPLSLKTGLLNTFAFSSVVACLAERPDMVKAIFPVYNIKRF